MNDDKLKRDLQDFIVRTVQKEIGIIVKNLQSVISIGTIVEVDYTAKRATMRVGGSVTGYIPYSRHFSDNQIGVNQMVLAVSPDPNNLNNKVIVATLTGI